MCVSSLRLIAFLWLLCSIGVPREHWEGARKHCSLQYNSCVLQTIFVVTNAENNNYLWKLVLYSTPYFYKILSSYFFFTHFLLFGMSSALLFFNLHTEKALLNLCLALCSSGSVHFGILCFYDMFISIKCYWSETV